MVYSFFQSLYTLTEGKFFLPQFIYRGGVPGFWSAELWEEDARGVDTCIGADTPSRA